MIEKANNIAFVIGKRKEHFNHKYGYYTYRVTPESSLKLVEKDFKHIWGLSSSNSFDSNETEENFWIKRNDLIYVAGLFDKKQNTLYSIITRNSDSSKIRYII